MNALIGGLGAVALVLLGLVLTGRVKVRSLESRIDEQSRRAKQVKEEAAKKEWELREAATQKEQALREAATQKEQALGEAAAQREQALTELATQREQALRESGDRERRAAEDTATRERAAREEAILQARRLLDQQLAEANAEVERIRGHYETESRRTKDESDQALAEALSQIGALQGYQTLMEEEGAATRLLAEALTEADRLRHAANEFFSAADSSAAEARKEARSHVSESRVKADAILDHATREAGRLVEDANRRAHQIGGDAYVALRDKQALDEALVAIRNIIEGYGDRYVIPTRSVLDDLAADFGHTEAGVALAAAREQTKRMVEEGHAAECDYAEPRRRDTAIRFVIGAFNGRVDAILSRSRHDNFGTLAQEINDAFALVNFDGTAFRNARILPAFRDARLAELKWAMAAHELRLREREEQRRLKEQIREEERARREYEQAMAAAQREERTLEQALVKAREAAERATAAERAVLESRIAALNEQLAEAEARNQRALSMAQQTKRGTIYVISNVGSFGEDVFKIGMTRRLEPMDRVKELGDASVPFEFDVHAMVSCDDAPALEARLHREFEDHRINKVNMRKEFFRVPLAELREKLGSSGAEASFTMLAEAREFRETEALMRMSPEERARYVVAPRNVRVPAGPLGADRSERATSAS